MEQTDKEKHTIWKEKFRKEMRPTWALCPNRETWDHEKVGNCSGCLTVNSNDRAEREEHEIWRAKFRKEMRPTWARCPNRDTWDHEKVGNCAGCLTVMNP